MLVVAAMAVGFLMVSCTGQGIEGRPFSAANEKLQEVWNGPRSWAEDWCDQAPGFRDAYSGLVAYRMRPYAFSIECPEEQ